MFQCTRNLGNLLSVMGKRMELMLIKDWRVEKIMSSTNELSHMTRM